MGAFTGEGLGDGEPDVAVGVGDGLTPEMQLHDGIILK